MNYAQMERETAHLLITGANWLTNPSSKFFAVALEGKEGSDHDSLRVQTSYQTPFLSCGVGLVRVGWTGIGGRGGILDHYLQVKPVADALCYMEQKRVQTTQKRYRSRHNERVTLPRGT